VVRVAAPALVRVPESGSVVKLNAAVRRYEAVRDMYIGQPMAWAWAQVAIEFPALLVTVVGARSKLKVPPLAARGKSHATDEV
jgi:hypothetical protein